LEERDVKRVGYLVVSTDRGLCGGLNINLFKKLLADMKAWSDKVASLRFLRIENILSPCIKEKVTSISPANNKRIIVRNCDDIRLC
ncbi:hypothetical protein MJL30_38490, partial [Salmonella enterica subsp. enterica serovar Anatum]|nr:hypothetical protein [Salmonella enterica subsp. enterica serovar Anatum]